MIVDIFIAIVFFSTNLVNTLSLLLSLLLKVLFWFSWSGNLMSCVFVDETDVIDDDDVDNVDN